MVKKNFRDQVVDTLIDQIAAGTAPWQKPWEPGNVRVPAFNPATGKPYRGMNQIWLEAQGFADPRWTTYRQSQANGYQVRKGEKGTQIEYWQWSDRRPMTDNSGAPILNDDGKQRYQEVRLERPKVFHAVVFNGSQIDGLEPFIGQEPNFNPVERAEQVLSDLNVPIFHDQRDRAFYQPGADEIHMPPKGLFKGQYEYYATALHEGGHSTGHHSRLAREGGPFGSESYAREELRAEIASFMTTTELGLGHYPERHASYIEGWMTAIKEDRNVLFQAARDAEVIKTWIMEPEKRLELTPAKERQQAMAQDQPSVVGQTVNMAQYDKMAVEREEIVNHMFENHPHAHPTLWAIDIQDTLVLAGNRENKEQLSADQIKEGLKASDLSNDNLRRFLGQTAEAANWGSFASIVPGYDEEHHAFAQLAEQFQKIDWVADYAASPERRATGIAHRDETLSLMEGEALASPLHRELASALWDLDGPRPKAHVQKPEWHVPAEQRKDEHLNRLREPLEISLSNGPINQSIQNQQNDLTQRKAIYDSAKPSTRIYKLDGMGDVQNFDSLGEAVRGLEGSRPFGMSNLSIVAGGRETTIIGNDWYNDGSNHRYTYLTPEMEKLHTAIRKQATGLENGDMGIDVAEGSINTVFAARDEKGKKRSQEARAMVGSIKDAPDTTDAEKKRVYLSVPFREKNEAKALGAKWDRRDKAWFVHEGSDMKAFAKWQKKVEPSSDQKIDPHLEFSAACRENGLILDGPAEMDGKWHRVSVDGDAKGKTSGSYRGFLEGIPAGQIMNFKTASEPVKWVASGTKMDPAELEKVKAQSAARKAEQEQELRFQYRQTAKRAYATFQNAIEASNDHPYLKRKQVSGETLRIDREGNLIMPMMNEKGFIENVQTIKPDGTKRYLKDGKKSGLMHVIPGKKDKPWIIAEGYATAKSLNAATGFTAVVAMDGGNLAVVAEALHKQNPDRQHLIAADDDHKQVEKVGFNPGLNAANKAAGRSDASILKPPLSPEDKLQGLTDFNDLHVSRGFDEFRKDVRKQLADLGVSVGRGKSIQATPKKQLNQSNQMTV